MAPKTEAEPGVLPGDVVVEAKLAQAGDGIVPSAGSEVDIGGLIAQVNQLPQKTTVRLRATGGQVEDFQGFASGVICKYFIDKYVNKLKTGRPRL